MTQRPGSAVQAPPAQFNFARHLFDLNAGRAGKDAYLDDAGAITYGQLQERARRCAAALLAVRILRGDGSRLLIAQQRQVAQAHANPASRRHREVPFR